MPVADYVAGLDVGTTKICTIVGRPSAQGTLDILGVGLCPAAGLKQGVVVDRQQATEAIVESVARAERMSGLRLRGVYVGMASSHILAYNETGRVHIDPSGEVVAGDVERAIQSACDSVPVGGEREIIYTIVRDFGIDGQPGTRRPLGMSGHRLDARVHIVTGMASVKRNLERCVETAGLEVQQCMLEQVATSLAVLAEAERDLGIMLIDIGGGTTDAAVFRDGVICHSGSVAVAGNHATRDLAQLLHISAEEAEAVKRKFGVASSDLVTGEELIQVIEIGTGEHARVPRRLLGEIIQPRLEEVFLLVRENLQQAGAYGMAVGGVVLTGGGSQLAGTERIASAVFDGLPVRRGSPRNLGKLGSSVASPIFATGVGLALQAALDGACAGEPPPAVRAAWLQPVSRWWSERVRPRIAAYLPPYHSRKPPGNGTA